MSDMLYKCFIRICQVKEIFRFFSELEKDKPIVLVLLNIRGLVNNLENFLADVNIQSVPVVLSN